MNILPATFMSDERYFDIFIHKCVMRLMTFLYYVLPKGTSCMDKKENWVGRKHVLTSQTRNGQMYRRLYVYAWWTKYPSTRVRLEN